MGRVGPGLARGEGRAGDHAAAARRAGYARAYDQARAAGDAGAMAEAALALAATQTFGTVPGRVPAFLHEAYTLARGEQRARLAVALARAGRRRRRGRCTCGPVRAASGGPASRARSPPSAT